MVDQNSRVEIGTINVLKGKATLSILCADGKTREIQEDGLRFVSVPCSSGRGNDCPEHRLWFDFFTIQLWCILDQKGGNIPLRIESTRHLYSGSSLADRVRQIAMRKPILTASIDPPVGYQTPWEEGRPGTKERLQEMAELYRTDPYELLPKPQGYHRSVIFRRPGEGRYTILPEDI